MRKQQGGPGVTGKAGVPTGTTPATPTPTGDTDTGSYNCYRDDTGEECCQRAPNPPLHWCSGDFPQFVCYNPKNQFCCANGKVCSDEDCCEDLFVRVAREDRTQPVVWLTFL